MAEQTNNEFEFEIRSPRTDSPLVDPKSLPDVEIKEDNKNGGFTFEVRQLAAAKKDNKFDPMALATEQFVATAGGAAAGFMSRTKILQDMVSSLVGSGVSPEAAIRFAESQLAAQPAGEIKSLEVRPVAQPAGATSTQIMEPGKMSSGDKWAKAIGGPGGETTEQAVENYHRRKALGAGETLLRSGIALPAGTNVRGAAASAIPSILEAENAAKAAREAAVATAAATAANTAERAKTLRSFGGKILGSLGGLGAGFQGYEAYKGFKNAETGPEYAQAVLDAFATAASAAGALPIPGAQLPGLALGAGIPAAGWLGRKISGALPDFGISEEAKRAVR
jgi:hypothetical protein